ncbi:MAG: arginine--tRNA ligase [Candidatus Paceibacterota bacterium]
MIQDQIRNLIKQAFYGQQLPNFTVEHPDELSHGDYATNIALILSKQLKKSPIEIAQNLVENLNKIKGKEITKIEIAGPGFINFYLSPEFFENQTKEILKQGKNFGRNILGKKKKVVVEYSSPNIAKPFTVGHLRSTIIGDAVANILDFSGFKVIRDNHLGDWGTQFGKLIVALKKWSDIKIIQKSQTPIKDLVDLYVKFHDEAEKDKGLEDEGRAWFAKLEKGDPEARKIWQKCVKLSLAEFKRIYKVLDVKFDTAFSESFFENKMSEVISDVKKTTIARESEGAYLVFFANEKYPPLMLLKSDGSSLYALRDLAADKWRKKKYGQETIIVNEVGGEQTLYFQQLFETEKLLGYVKEGERKHVAHGLYRFAEGKMSTRKGNVIWLDEVINEAIDRAKTINQDTAEVVAIGALKFNDLKREAKGDINFDWDEILNLKGDSGPYLQYSCVRAKAILEKARKERVKLNWKKAGTEITNLEKMIYRFPEVVARAGKEYAPHYLALYLIELAGEFNTFYAQGKIVDKTDANSPYKVALTSAFVTIIQNGLKLFGIKVPDRM